MGTRMINGRLALDRAGIVDLTGAALPTVEYWHANRESTDFPEPCWTDPATGRQWFWQTEVTAFHQAHQAAKANALTRVDHSGDPDELVSSTEAARILGYKSHRNLPRGLRENPDHTEELPDGRKLRRWRRATVWAAADNRITTPASGRPKGTGTGRAPHGYANDPRLAEAILLVQHASATGTSTRGLGAQLARQLDTDERTAQRLIAAAKDALAET